MVSVVIPARNAAATLGRTLDALLRQDLEGDLEVIVVDDGSTDTTLQVAAAVGGPVVVSRNEQSGGAGAARNKGAEMARAPVLAFTDADCFPAPDWLSKGLRWVEQFDLVQGAVEPDPEAERRPFDRTLTVRREEGYYQTANLFVRRKLFDSLGGFEDWIVEGGGEGVFGWRASSDQRPARAALQPMGEDVLFGWRARRASARIAFAADAVVRHAVFRQSLPQAVRYRWRWVRHMPGLAARVPELRQELFYRRWFLARRSAEFDLALVSLLVAMASRRRAPVVGAAPYALRVYREAAAWRQHAFPAAVGTVATETVALAALLVGSVHWREPLL